MKAKADKALEKIQGLRSQRDAAEITRDGVKAKNLRLKEEKSKLKEELEFAKLGKTLDWKMLIRSEAFIETKELLAQRLFDEVVHAVRVQPSNYNIPFLYPENAEATIGSSKVVSGPTSLTLGQVPLVGKIGAIQELDAKEAKKTTKAAALAKWVGRHRSRHLLLKLRSLLGSC